MPLLQKNVIFLFYYLILTNSKYLDNLILYIGGIIMKKRSIFGILMVLLLSIGLSACSATETSTYKKTQDNTTATDKITHRGDKVLSENETVTSDYSGTGATADQLKTVTSTVKSKMDEYGKKKGIDTKFKVDGQKMKVQVKIDYSKVLADDLKAIDSNFAGSGVKKVSYNKTVKQLKSDGYKLQKGND